MGILKYVNGFIAKDVKSMAEVARDARIKNVVWLLLGGYIMFIYFVIVGTAYVITIIGAKKGYACYKLAVFAVMPFGVNVAVDFWSHKIGNPFFALTTGWQASVVCLVFGAIMQVSYVGRYLANRWFHLSQYALMPFGAKVQRISRLGEQEKATVLKRNEFLEFEI